jgi:tRNA1(Val) A37 N6-methylase TrmN6
MDGRKPKNYQGKYYDVAISNPPYKTRQTKQRGLGELQEFDRFEDYFTYRQLQMVKP